MDVAETPYFSIVIISLNARDSIARTLQSVLRQTILDYEIIVKDGCSTDGTMGMIPQSERIRTFEEKDAGIYDAMNQAVNYAKGRYVSFLNCGDEFYDEFVLENARRTGIMQDAPCVLYGNTYFRGTGSIRVPPNPIDDYFWYRTTLCHQSVFFARELFSRGNRYDVAYKVASDFKLMVQFYKEKVPFVPLGITVCFYEGGGFSETGKGLAINRAEKKRIIGDAYTPFQRLGFFCRHATIALKHKIIRP